MSPSKMEYWINNLTDAWLAQSGLEVFAVITGVLYLILAAKESLWCWLFAACSTLAYLILLIQVKLYAESALQVYYLVMAAYGFYSWKNGANKEDHELAIISGSFKFHVFSILSIGLGTAVLGFILASVTDAQLPYIDAFTTIGALLTTWMVTRKYLENWIYWFVIDGVAVYMYWTKELYLTAMLFAFYVVMVVVGFMGWRKTYLHSQHRAA